MKIDRTKIKRSSTEVPPDCKVWIDKIKSCKTAVELYDVIGSMESWTCGKCELYHWIDVLDIFDSYLEQAAQTLPDSKWAIAIDAENNDTLRNCVAYILSFTTLLIEHSFSRHLYNSMDHLVKLLNSTHMLIILDVLQLLYMFSKRSNFLTRLPEEKRESVLDRLTYIADSWGGKEAGFGLAACCTDLPDTSFPTSARSVHMELPNPTGDCRGKSDFMNVVHYDDVTKLADNPAAAMDLILDEYGHLIPDDKKIALFTHLRLAFNFFNFYQRCVCVQARLQALSIMVYTNNLHENLPQLLYSGLMEEIVNVLELDDPRLTEIKAAGLRALTSVIHLDRAQNFPSIIDVTGIGSYHGFLPIMVRNCITSMISPLSFEPNSEPYPAKEPYPISLATALFSFIYHLASYELGGEALVSCGMLESLLKVVTWKPVYEEQITFVTRAVRVIDLITNMDMQGFHTHGGLNTFINRLESEVTTCRKEQPFEIVPEPSTSLGRQNTASSQDPEDIGDEVETSTENPEIPLEVPMDTDGYNPQTVDSSNPGPSSSAEPGSRAGSAVNFVPSTQVCLPQRAALLKSLLNFLKKVIQDASFSDSIRHIMETSLPNSLRHIISNAEYYGSSLFLLATDVVTVYVFQEPSLLSALQDSGLTDVVQEAILVKQVPATREVIASIPNIFSALCLNNRGLNAFLKCKPFHKICKLLISPQYLAAMRRRRSAEPMGDTATNLGNAMDELMRHQPGLRTEATTALVKLLEDLCGMSHDARNTNWKEQPQRLEQSLSTTRPGTSDVGSSEEDEDDDEPSISSRLFANQPAAAPSRETTTETGNTSNSDGKAPALMVDYIFNVMKFLDAILSNNATDDHCREFVTQQGIRPLVSVFSLPNLPLDFPNTTSCQAVSSVCKSILCLAHERKVLEIGLQELEKALQGVEPLCQPLPTPGSSVLLHEVAMAKWDEDDVIVPGENPTETPILTSMTVVHSFVMMFIQACRTGQPDIRIMSTEEWGNELGLNVLKKLSKLYVNLIWESTVLLAICSGEYTPGPGEFARADLDVIFPPSKDKTVLESNSTSSDSNADRMEVDNSEMSPSSTRVNSSTQTSLIAKSDKTNKTLQEYAKLLKPALSASSRLGRALVEFFGLLVKLAIGTPSRQRRGAPVPPGPNILSGHADNIATVLSELLSNCLRREPIPDSCVRKFQQSICAIGFSSALLFDEKKFVYHLMLKKFVESKGLNALFDVFYWAMEEDVKGIRLNNEDDANSLAEQQTEFFEAWLLLIQRLVHSQVVLETPHSLPTKNGFTNKNIVFNSKGFLDHMHKLAFKAILFLWKSRPIKSFKVKETELMLSILCNILQNTEITVEPPKSTKSNTENSSENQPVEPVASTSSCSAHVPATTTATATPAVVRPAENSRYRMPIADDADSSPVSSEELYSSTSDEDAEINPLFPDVLTRERRRRERAEREAARLAREQANARITNGEVTTPVENNIETPAPVNPPPPVQDEASVEDDTVFDPSVSFGQAVSMGEEEVQPNILPEEINQVTPQNGSEIISSDVVPPVNSDSTTTAEPSVDNSQPGPSVDNSQPGPSVDTPRQVTPDPAPDPRYDLPLLVPEGGERLYMPVPPEVYLRHPRGTFSAVDDVVDRYRQRQQAARNATDTNNGNSSTGNTASVDNLETVRSLGIDPAQVQQLVDMGFHRSLCIEALLITSNDLIQATDYLLNNTSSRGISGFTDRQPPPLLPNPTAAAGSSNSTQQGPRSRQPSRSIWSRRRDWDDNEEDIFRAVMMSLDGKAVGKLPKLEDKTKYESLTAEEIDAFTSDAFESCMELLDEVPDAVYRVCELLVAVGCRRGYNWTIDTIKKLSDQLIVLFAVVRKMLKKEEFEPPAFAKSTSSYDAMLCTRLHLFSLIFEELKFYCFEMIQNSKLIQDSVDLLHTLANAYTDPVNPQNRIETTPLWLAPAILLLDLYEKAATASRRKAILACETDHVWKWYDINSGKWCAYSTPNNHVIDKAFWEGETSVRITAGRRRYVIHFNGMVQLNEETSNRRPITLWLKPTVDPEPTKPENIYGLSVEDADYYYEDKNKDTPNIRDFTISYPCPTNLSQKPQPSGSASATKIIRRENEKMDTEEEVPTAHKTLFIISGLSSKQIQEIILCCVGFLKLTVEPETLNATMRLCLRLTRSFKWANYFTENGGVGALLKINSAYHFNGFLALSNMLIRHCLEDRKCLRFAIEKMIREKICTPCAATCKELHYLLRVLAPVACRAPELFVNVAKEILRVDIPFVTRRGMLAEEDKRLIVKPLPSKPESLRLHEDDEDHEWPREVIHQLLLSLAERYDDDDEECTKKTVWLNMQAAKCSRPGGPGGYHSTNPVPGSRGDLVVDPFEQMDLDGPTTSTATTSQKSVKNEVNEWSRNTKPLIAKSTILQILAESVHSYSYSCKVIAEFSFKGGTFKNVPEDCTALSFLLDRLGPLNQFLGIKDSNTILRDLLAAMGCCNHLPEAQAIVVSEVKAALQRILAMRESAQKHLKIQYLVNLISYMIEMCPSSVMTQFAAIKLPHVTTFNQVIRLLLKKNVVTDLARIVHHIDLTSKHVAQTVNSVLKCLEVISRVVNFPLQPAQTRPRPKSETNQQDSDNNTHTAITSNSEGTRAQGEEIVEDAENTEHDISAAAESLDPISEGHTQDPNTAEQDEEAFEEIMDQLLDRDNTHADDVLNDTQNSLMDTEESVDQRRNENYDRDNRDHHEHDSDSSISEEGSSEGDGDDEDEDDDEHNGEDDDEDEDDEDDEVDEEDMLSNYDDNQDEERLLRGSAMDRDDEMLMVQYSGGDDAGPIFLTSNTNYNYNMGFFEETLTNDQSNAGLRVTHPLLQPPAAENAVHGSVSRGHRTGRQRRYQFFQYINPRHPPPPAILQRLLGPSTAQDVIQLTTGQTNHQGARDARLMVLDSNTEQNVTRTNNGSSGTLSNFAALHWWCDEAKVLDGDSMHDCIVAIKRCVVETVEADRDKAFQARREKRKQDEEAKRKAQEQASAAAAAAAAAATNASTATQPPTTESNSTTTENETVTNVTPAVTDGFVTDTLMTPAEGAEVNQQTTEQNNILDETVIDMDRVSDDMSGTTEQESEVFVETTPRGEEVQIEGQSNQNNTDGETLQPLENHTSALDNITDVPVEMNQNMLSEEGRTTSERRRPRPGENYIIGTTFVVGEPLPGDDIFPGWPSEFAIQNRDQVSSEPVEPPAAAGATAVAEPVAGPSGVQNNTFREILGDIEIPEGVDPSFLAALPEDMRQEVISEHLRIQRLRQRASQPVSDSTAQSAVEVSPEFLAALPPSIQEEVLAQQRLEHQRRAATTANPNEPVDAAAFFRTLQPNLRQVILADMEESQMASIPAEFAEEAQTLRRSWETRNTQFIQDRLYTGPSASTTLSAILRQTGMRLTGRFGLHPSGVHRSQWPGGWLSRQPALTHQNNFVNAKAKGKQLMDFETLSCLMVILFLDDSKINTGRLHRVIRNLCYHSPTRMWVLKSLLSVLEKSNESHIFLSDDRPATSSSIYRPSPNKSSLNLEGDKKLTTYTYVELVPSWLNISLDSALGCSANVFQIYKAIGSSAKKMGNEQRFISIHSQAVTQIAKHTIDILSNLAKSFPAYFLPHTAVETEVKILNTDPCVTPDSKKVTQNPCSSTSTKSKSTDAGDMLFWDYLLKLDGALSGKKGKSLTKLGLHTNPTGDPSQMTVTFEASAFGKLIKMLGYPFIRRSQLLTDKLLRLLSLISLGIPENSGYGKSVLLAEPTTPVDESSLISESHLRLIVEVITSKNCSEEGLEEATALLLNLSYGPPTTRNKILTFLTEGVRDLGIVVCSHIVGLISELKTLQVDVEKEEDPHSSGTDPDSSEKIFKGMLTDRFTKETVVITAASKSKTTYELQLPSMAALTSKTSSQAFFLRILKVIMNLRDLVRGAIKKHKQKGSSTSTSEAQTPASTAPNTSRAQDRPRFGSEALRRFLNRQLQFNLHGRAAANLLSIDEIFMDIGAADTPPTVRLSPMQAGQGPASIVSGHYILREPSTRAQEATTTVEMNINEDVVIDETKLLPRLSAELQLEELWSTLSECLLALGHTPDHHAVLVLQPAVEAFFLVHTFQTTVEEKKKNTRETREAQLAHLQEETPPVIVTNQSENITQNDTEMTDAPTSSSTNLDTSGSSQTLSEDTKKFLDFADTHRTVLNHILRQSTGHLADGPFAILEYHTRVLDFDVKRRYFRTELDRLDEGVRREDLAVHVRRAHVFEDSFRELHRKSAEEWKNRFYIVFEGEEGQDAGGLLREWYVIISREIFNPMYALFTISPGDRVTYMINSSSHCNSNHLFYFKFVGRVIAKAVYDNKLLECYFTRSFYKHILGKYVKHIDMESEDYAFFQGLAFLLDHHIAELGYDLTFSTEVQEFGVTEVRDLVPNGRNIPVTEENKIEYVRLVCQMKMTGAIRKQLNAFLEGFYDIIPKRLISIFNEQELELLVSGLPNVDIEDLKANTEYHKYQANSLQIQWFWRALRSFDQADRAKFLQFVTGTSKVPLQGFGSLEGMNGVQKFQIHRDDRSTDRLPSAHTCFNQLDLPAYETYDKLRTYLLKAIHECSEGFGFA